MILREASIILGMVPPKGAAHCSCQIRYGKYFNPSIEELAIASRRNRWEDLAKVQEAFFSAAMQKVSEYEEKMLEALGLPDLNDVRVSIIAEIPPRLQQGRFVFNDTKKRKVEALVKQWILDLFGDEKYIKTPDQSDLFDFGKWEAIFIQFMMRAFKVGADHAFESIKNSIPPGLVLSYIFPDPEGNYVRALLRDAGKRIRTELAINNMDILFAELAEMANNGEWPITVGRRLHNIVGEGEAWYWNRITRSEAVLAAGAAFDAMAAGNGAKYETWSTAPDGCIICQFFDGKMWKLGDGPHPVQDNHPHCGCSRIASWEPMAKVQDRWTRPTPYDQPYKPEELDNLRDLLRTRLGDRVDTL